MWLVCGLCTAAQNICYAWLFVCGIRNSIRILDDSPSRHGHGHCYCTADCQGSHFIHSPTWDNWTHWIICGWLSYYRRRVIFRLTAARRRWRQPDTTEHQQERDTKKNKISRRMCGVCVSFVSTTWNVRYVHPKSTGNCSWAKHIFFLCLWMTTRRQLPVVISVLCRGWPCRQAAPVTSATTSRVIHYSANCISWKLTSFICEKVTHMFAVA